MCSFKHHNRIFCPSSEKEVNIYYIADITNFLAPEVTDKFTQASDVWALGCILLELTTTSLYTKEEIMEKIKEIKEDSFVMEQIFEEISKVKELVKECGRLNKFG